MKSSETNIIVHTYGNVEIPGTNICQEFKPSKDAQTFNTKIANLAIEAGIAEKITRESKNGRSNNS